MRTNSVTRTAAIAVGAAMFLVSAALGQAATAPARPQSPPTATARAPLTADEIDVISGTLAGATDEALPAATPAIGPDFGSGRAGSGDDLLLAALFRYASDAHGGRLAPPRIDRRWALQPEPFDIAAGFDRARATATLPAWLAALAPQAAGYRRLRAGYARYRAIAAAGGWPAISGRAWKPGDRDGDVAALRARLRLEGYVAEPAAEEDAFDNGLATALSLFQRRHGLHEDGALNKETRAALNIDVATRLTQIAINLERWRWLPRTIAPTRIDVNVAGGSLTLVRDDVAVATHRVIVGRKRFATPVFADAIEGIVLNPSWTVPESIAAREITPAAARDVSYLSRHHFTQTDGRFVQAPGPDNALGQIKFAMTNGFGIYLHDTPARALFERDDRRLSHGCVRVEAPLDLATALLGAQGWTRETIQAEIATGVTRRIAIDPATPVFITYFTAVADPDGVITFLPDVYDWDSALTRALASADTA